VDNLWIVVHLKLTLKGIEILEILAIIGYSGGISKRWRSTLKGTESQRKAQR
jgi:hypothetical protein